MSSDALFPRWKCPFCGEIFEANCCSFIRIKGNTVERVCVGCEKHLHENSLKKGEVGMSEGKEFAKKQLGAFISTFVQELVKVIVKAVTRPFRRKENK